MTPKHQNSANPRSGVLPKNKQKKRLIAGYNTARTAIPDLHEGVADSIEEVLRDFSTSSAGENYNIRFAIYNSAMDAVGKKKRQNTNCLQTAVKLTLPKARASDRSFCKRAAVFDYKRESSDKALTYCTQEGQDVDAQRIARRYQEPLPRATTKSYTIGRTSSLTQQLREATSYLS